MTARLITRGFLAAVALAAVVVGAPWFFAQAGTPIPTSVPSLAELAGRARVLDIPDEFWLKGAALVGWGLWALFLFSVVLEIGTRMKRPWRAALQVASTSPIRAVAAPLVAAIFTALPARNSDAPSAVIDLTGATVASATLAVEPASEVQPPGTTAYSVRRWDNLSRIARRELGDVSRWREIWELNKYRSFGDMVFDDWDRIYKGWVLWLPTPATDGGLAPEACGPQVHQPAPEPPLSRRDAVGTPSSALPGGDHDPSSSTTTTSSTSSTTAPPAVPPPEPTGPAIRIVLPSGSALGLSFAVGVLFNHALSTIHRRRAYRPGKPRPVRPADTPAPPEPRRSLSQAVNSAAGEARTIPAPRVDQRDPTPGRVEAGHAPEQVLDLDPITLGVLRVNGSGASDVARGVVASALFRCAPSDLRVVMDMEAAATLFKQLPEMPGLDVFDRTRVVEEIQLERVRRNRVLDASDRPDFGAYRRDPTDELLGALLVVACPQVDDDQLFVALAGAPRLGIGAILLGDHAATGSAITVAADGTVAGAEGDVRHLEGATLHRLTDVDATELVRELSETRRLAEAPEPAEPIEEPFPVERVVATADAARAPVRVRLFGPMTIEAGGEPLRAGLLDKARELCAVLALHPEGLRRERLVEDLWPDVDLDKRQDRFSASVSSLRRCIRRALGRPDLEVVCCEGDQYRLETPLYDVDLWRFQAALAPNLEPAEADLLREGLSAYQGEFVEGAPWEWVEPTRESLRRQALNAAVRLAVIEQESGRLEQAINVIDHAIQKIDAYAEFLYVREAELLVAAGRVEAAQALYENLKTQLEQIGEEPMPDTVRAIGELLTEGRRMASVHRHRAEAALGAEPASGAS